MRQDAPFARLTGTPARGIFEPQSGGESPAAVAPRPPPPAGMSRLRRPGARAEGTRSPPSRGEHPAGRALAGRLRRSGPGPHLPGLRSCGLDCTARAGHLRAAVQGSAPPPRKGQETNVAPPSPCHSRSSPALDRIPFLPRSRCRCNHASGPGLSGCAVWTLHFPRIRRTRPLRRLYAAVQGGAAPSVAGRDPRPHRKAYRRRYDPLPPAQGSRRRPLVCRRGRQWPRAPGPSGGPGLDASQETGRGACSLPPQPRRQSWRWSQTWTERSDEHGNGEDIRMAKKRWRSG